MAVNRYDNPAQAEFINTYVPIPFEELYTLGKDAADRVNDTLKAYTTARTKWGEFQSQSAVDMQNWDRLTMGTVRPYIEAASRNPELMKDPGWQMQVQSAIANVDTAALNKLKQNADNFNAYLENVQKLMTQDKYNSLWHDRNFSNWNTLGSDGLFNETPTPYSSVVDMVHPYVDNLKPNSLGNRNGYLWEGVTPERTLAQVNAHMSDILATPQAAMHVKTLMDSGLTQEEALAAFIGQVNTAAREMSWEKMTGADPYALVNARVRAAASVNSQTGTQSFNQDLAANLGINTLGKLKQAMIAKANANGDTESANVWNNMSNEQLAEAYNAAWSSAFASGNTSEIKSLMDYSTARVSPGYAAKLVDPSVGETGGTKPIEFKIGEEAPSYGQRIDRNSMFGTVLFNHNGIPVAEISKSFILNNDKNLIDLVSGFNKDAKASKIQTLRDNIGNFMETLTSLLSPVFVANGNVMQMDNTNSNYPYRRSNLVMGEGFISEDQLNAICKTMADSDQFGNLTSGDIRRILTNGLDDKRTHGIMTEVEHFKVDDDDTEGSTYYKFSMGYPYDDPVRRLMWDDIYSSDVFGTTNTFKSRGTHIQHAGYDNTKFNNSNL